MGVGSKYGVCTWNHLKLYLLNNWFYHNTPESKTPLCLSETDRRRNEIIQENGKRYPFRFLKRLFVFLSSISLYIPSFVLEDSFLDFLPQYPIPSNALTPPTRFLTSKSLHQAEIRGHHHKEKIGKLSLSLSTFFLLLSMIEISTSCNFFRSHCISISLLESVVVSCNLSFCVWKIEPFFLKFLRDFIWNLQNSMQDSWLIIRVLFWFFFFFWFNFCLLRNLWSKVECLNWVFGLLIGVCFLDNAHWCHYYWFEVELPLESFDQDRGAKLLIRSILWNSMPNIQNSISRKSF